MGNEISLPQAERGCMGGHMCIRVRVDVRVDARVRASARVCASVCARACVHYTAEGLGAQILQINYPYHVIADVCNNEPVACQRSNAIRARKANLVTDAIGESTVRNPREIRARQGIGAN